MPVKGAKNPIICILRKLRNYESVSFSDLASKLFNRYQFPLVKTIGSPFADTPFHFFLYFAKKIHGCKESFGKRLRRHIFSVCKTYYLTDVDKRLRGEFCP